MGEGRFKSSKRTLIICLSNFKVKLEREFRRQLTIPDPRAHRMYTSGLFVFEPPLNNFATNELENGNFTATVKTNAYPEGTPFSNSSFRSLPYSLKSAPSHILV